MSSKVTHSWHHFCWSLIFFADKTLCSQNKSGNLWPSVPVVFLTASPIWSLFAIHPEDWTFKSSCQASCNGDRGAHCQWPVSSNWWIKSKNGGGMWQKLFREAVFGKVAVSFGGVSLYPVSRLVSATDKGCVLLPCCCAWWKYCGSLHLLVSGRRAACAWRSDV